MKIKYKKAWLILHSKCDSKHWYAWGADGRSLYGHVITKFSRMGSLPLFLSCGAPQARFACQSSATISQVVQKCLFPVNPNNTLDLNLFASPTSLHFSVHLSYLIIV